MSVSHLVERAQSMAASGDAIDWRTMRDDIHNELEKNPTTEERITLLQLFTAIMDLLERNLEKVDPDKIPDLRNVREADYRLMIVKESMIGENVCADILLEITDREIAAGRMAPDNGLRALAIEGTSIPHPTRERLQEIAAEKSSPPKRGLFSIFKR
jgi:hypothetical protein